MSNSRKTIINQCVENIFLFLKEEDLIQEPTTNDPEAFLAWLKENEANILDRKTEFEQPVFANVNFNETFQKCDSEQAEMLWEHILTTFGAAYPEKVDKVKALMMIEKPNHSSISKEEDFIRSAIGTIENSLEGKEFNEENKLDILTSIFNNNQLGKLIQDVQSKVSTGELDIGKMLFASQKILKEDSGEDIDLMGEISKMMSGLQ